MTASERIETVMRRMTTQVMQAADAPAAFTVAVSGVFVGTMKHGHGLFDCEDIATLFESAEAMAIEAIEARNKEGQ